MNSEKKNYSLRDALLTKNKEGDYTKHFLHPWNNFAIEAKNRLDTTIISFKQNLRVINKTNNKTWQWVKKEGEFKKVLVKQTKGNNWAIRKPMHKETVSGKVTLLRERKTPVNFSKALENWQLIVDKNVKLKVKSAFKLFDYDLKKVKKHFKDNPLKTDGIEVTKVVVYEKIEATATRTALSEKFTQKQLESITDLGIQKILENHLKNFTSEEGKEQFDLAFSVEGIEALNKNIVQLNNGKNHQPIYKVRLFEVGSKFAVSEDKESAKNTKYVEAAKGTNLFFAIYWDAEKKKRVYDTIPLNDVIEHQKWRATITNKEERNNIPNIPAVAAKGQFLFSLSPNDLVYAPTEEELENQNKINFNSLNEEQITRIYLFTDGSGTTANFIPNSVANIIFNMPKKEQEKKGLKYPIQNEYGIGSPQSKNQKSNDGIMIKEICWKLKVDRLGNVIKVIK